MVRLRCRVLLLAALCCALLAALAGVRPAAAQDGVASPRAAAVPGFWDPRRRPERPDLSRIQSIRFLTEMDYPPFDSGGVQRRSCPAVVRRDQDHLHHPGAAL
jgi:polar amino acid transport system substrate-binding protein